MRQGVNQHLLTIVFAVIAIYFGVTFDSLDDADEVLPAHDDFVKSQIALAKSRGLLHEYM